MPIPPHPCRQRGQWSLIGTLVAVAILIVLAALYLPKMLKPAGPSKQDQTAIQDANGAACSIYLSQMNSAAAEYKQDNGHSPSSLNDLKQYGVTSDMIASPDCSFQMDPATGIVTNAPRNAPTPGMQTMPGSAAPPGVAPPRAPANGTPGPGGITIPNIPGSAGGA